MSENISNIYAKLFKHYLEFLPQYRRNLIESKEMHKWLKDLDFGTRLNNYSDFVIYLEFLNAKFIPNIHISRKTKKRA